MLELSTASTEFVKVPVVARIDGLSADPTADVVKLAILPTTTVVPADDDWLDGDWETDVYFGYLARTLIAAGALAVGTYAVWVRIAHAPEVIVRRSPGAMRVS